MYVTTYTLTNVDGSGEMGPLVLTAKEIRELYPNGSLAVWVALQLVGERSPGEGDIGCSMADVVRGSVEIAEALYDHAGGVFYGASLPILAESWGLDISARCGSISPKDSKMLDTYTDIYAAAADCDFYSAIHCDTVTGEITSTDGMIRDAWGDDVEFEYYKPPNSAYGLYPVTKSENDDVMPHYVYLFEPSETLTPYWVKYLTKGMTSFDIYVTEAVMRCDDDAYQINGYAVVIRDTSDM